jgi:hypothetical protein
MQIVTMPNWPIASTIVARSAGAGTTTRRLRQSDPAAKLRERDAAVLLQDLQDGDVLVIEVDPTGHW